MTLKKLWRWVKIIYSLFFLLAIVLFVSFFGILIFGILIDKDAILNTALMNVIALGMSLVSLPGILVQLVSMLSINDKKTFTLEKKCPHCRQLIELKLTED